jgi:adenosylmethionine-8-amino-7-oxononanoate aminotransferase
MTSKVLHRSLLGAPPVAVAGEGPFVIDRDGKRYLDASSGAAVSCLGHSHPAVIAAIEAQLERLPYVHSGFFSSEPAERLADFLAARAPGGLNHVFFTSGGSEATESAMKLARQYMVESGQPQRHRFIARQQSYHGNTLGALALGGHRPRRKLYEPMLIEASHIAPCFAYRHRRDDESEEAYGLRAAAALEQEILRLGPESVAAFFAETVVGATAGCVPPVPGYFKRVRDICDRYGVLLVLDEVMSGMGRTGSLFACEQDEVVPDLLTCAKGLAAGYQPIGAVMVSDRIYGTLQQGSGAFQHGFTYIGHATACAAALAVQETIERDDLLANVRRQGQALREGLEERFGNHRHIGDIRGRGLFLGLELVADRASKEPFDPARKLHLQVKREAFARGLLCYPSGGTIDGARGDHVMLAPPYIIDEGHIATIVQVIGEAVDAAIAGA